MYSDFIFDDQNYIILRKISSYIRTESGKSWKSKPESVKREVISPEFYTTYVSSSDIFSKWGDGASCRVKKGYTCAGYLPNVITSVSPFRTTKQIAEFKFLSKKDYRKTPDSGKKTS